MTEWLEGTEIGTASRFGKLMLACSVAEQGGDPEEQSALLLIEEFGEKNTRRALTTGEGDERFHIVGGNDQLMTGMLDELPPETVQLGHQLVALRTPSDGGYKLVLDVAGTTCETTADIVVLALPFTTLNEVDLSKSGLSATKRNVIETFGMGTNAKIHSNSITRAGRRSATAATCSPNGKGCVAAGTTACRWDPTPPRCYNRLPRRARGAQRSHGRRARTGAAIGT